MKNEMKKLGFLYGYDVYIDMSSRRITSAKKKENDYELAENFFSNAFKNADFIKMLSEVINNNDL
jgi:hypothetical protein